MSARAFLNTCYLTTSTTSTAIMSVSHFDQTTVLEDDKSSVWTSATPPESTIAELSNLKGLLVKTLAEKTAAEEKLAQMAKSPPKPTITVLKHGKVFQLRSLPSRGVLTLLGGDVVLAPEDTLGSTLWMCDEINGWFGFFNIASGKVLGRNAKDSLCCLVDNVHHWQYFIPKTTEDGTHILLMMMMRDGENFLVGRDASHGLVVVSPEATNVEILHWEFEYVKVEAIEW
ncbi:hypothetical protein K402DRAFT_43655 [Aulographum hederae CBS 113979]|uniref:Uncharacterized protein n=1 Tax=Aulographum hederae CBS 113979 TaxID=1176131 RepID=A0A6G1H392_9PEZI|nr:hypothetical protein K402DRAFT_43655 [Aulographum hederae CBS 113979]